MLVGHGALSTAGYRYGLAGARFLAGPSLSALEEIRAKYGDGPVPAGDANQMQDIMATLVYPLFTDKDWQYCTINNWLVGTPSEDDLSWKEKYFTEMPTLEESCGDHAWGNQFEAAFKDFKAKGAPQEVIDWLREKGKPRQAAKKKMAEDKAKENLGKAAEGTKQKLNPFENPWVVGGVAAALTLLLVIRLKK